MRPNTVRLECFLPKPKQQLGFKRMRFAWRWFDDARVEGGGHGFGQALIVRGVRRVASLDHAGRSLACGAHGPKLAAAVQQFIEPTLSPSGLRWGERPRTGAERGAAGAGVW